MGPVEVTPSATGRDRTAPICLFCMHLTHTAHGAQSATCAAFPSGIPDAIWQNRVDHRASVKGDHGLRFDPLPGGTAYADQTFGTNNPDELVSL